MITPTPSPNLHYKMEKNEYMKKNPELKFEKNIVNLKFHFLYFMQNIYMHWGTVLHKMSPFVNNSYYFSETSYVKR